MSLTVAFTPPAYSSFNEDLIYTTKSDKTADPSTYPNFKFIGDVYIGGLLVARLKKDPNPTTGVGVFNIGQVVRSYIQTLFNPTFGQLVMQVLGNQLFNLSVQMKFGESYNFTDFLNVTIDSMRPFFNSYNARGGAFNSSLAQVLDKVASNRSTFCQAILSQRFNLIPYFPTSTSSIPITITPAGGGIPYSTTIPVTSAYDMQIINLAPANLNAVQPGTITANTKHYDVVIGSQSYRFYVICEATYTPYMIHFLSKYGGFESKSFNKVSRYSIAITRTTFGKYPYTIGSDGVAQEATTNRVYNELSSTYASQYTESKVFNTDFLNDQDYSWLSDLMVSSMIYLEEPNGDFFPVVITDSNYDIKKNVNDGLTNLTLTVSYGATLNAQYR